MRDVEPGEDAHGIPRRHLLRKAGLIGAAAAGLSALLPSEALAESVEDLEGKLREIAAGAGRYNVAVGLNAGNAGEKNVAVGSSAGKNATGSGNVLIGYQAGEEAGSSSDSLYIANSNTKTPLIGGNFAADEVTIHGSLAVTGAITGELPSSVANSSAAMISPLTYGAKFDGATDDSKAFEESIAAAVAGGGTPIIMPAGTTRIAKTLKVPHNLGFQLVIRGASMRATTVLLEGTQQFLSPANSETGAVAGNVALSDFSVNGGGTQVEGAFTKPVVYGNNVSSNSKMHMMNVDIRRIRVFNVPTLEEAKNGRRAIEIHIAGATGEATTYKIEKISIREMLIEGCQYGVGIVGASTSTAVAANVYLGDIYVADITHIIPEAAKAFGASCNLQIGGQAWSDGKNIVIERIHGENSGDVGIELDVPAILADCFVRNANDTAFLFNTFNVATTAAPVLSATTATVKAGESTIPVENAAQFTAGQQLYIDVSGNTTAGKVSEVRTIKAVNAGAKTIELTEALGEEHVTGVWVQEVGDVSAVSWRARNLTGVRTVNLPGANSGLVVQNSNNVTPAPGVYIDGYRYYRDVAGRPATQGEALKSQVGTANSPTGSPHVLSVRNMQVDIQGLENTTAETQSYEPIYLVMYGAAFPLTIQGEISVEGAGVTGSGKLNVRLAHVAVSGILDLDLITKCALGSTGGEIVRCIELNQESFTGDLTGRVRHRARKSSITTGGGTFVGIRLGYGAGFASQSTTTKTKGGELAEKATVIPVLSTEGFAVGQSIVIDALSPLKPSHSEIFTISSIQAGESLTVVSAGSTPGTKVAHAEPCVVAVCRDLVIEDSDWLGLGSTGTAISFEDENLAARLKMRGDTYPVPSTPSKQTLPASGVAFQVLGKGQPGLVSVESGTVTVVEWSPDGKNFFKLASATADVFHVSPGDYVKLTWSVEPTVNFLADRV